MSGKRTKTPRLSDAGARMLTNLVNGRSIGAHLSGRSEHGGASATEAALRRHGWIDCDAAITDAGRTVLASYQRR